MLLTKDERKGAQGLTVSSFKTRFRSPERYDLLLQELGSFINSKKTNLLSVQSFTNKCPIPKQLS